MSPIVRYPLEAARSAKVLAAVAAALIVLHLVSMQAYFNDAWGIADRFDLEYWHVSVLDLDEEESFGTWFSSGILFLSSLLLLVRARIARSQQGPWHRWWWVLGAGFLFLSIDEVVGLHEYLNTAMEDAPWTVVGGPILLVVGLSYLPFLREYWGRSALLFLAAGAVYGGGAVGVEHFTDAQVNSLHYNMWTALEEGMEMFGVILFIYALLDHMGGRLVLTAGTESGEAADPSRS